MCRFLLVRSKKELKPENLLTDFSLMCQRSHAPDGDWQGDGWGITWEENNSLRLTKSLLPIWEEQNKFSLIPRTKLFAVHARSAGFPQHKGILDYNQPYIRNNVIFVFNGMIRGVRVPRVLDGKIGAQKIFSYLQKELISSPPDKALDKLHRTLCDNAEKIEGMNIVLVRENKFFLLCTYADHKSYFSLRYYHSAELTIVCSEPLRSYRWTSMKKDERLVL